MKLKKILVCIVLFLFFIQPFIAHSLHQKKAIVFYNKACADCTSYIESELLPLLNELGIEDIEMKDYVNDRQNRALLNQKSEQLGIPPKLQGHFTIFIDDRIVLEGHVPESIIKDIFEYDDSDQIEKIVVFQDNMESMGHDVMNYKVWAFRGDIKEYPINIPIKEYLDWFNKNKDSLSTVEQKDQLNLKTFIPLLLATGFFDGLNPCAFAVLLFFITFLFTLHRTKQDIFKVGFVYILMIYLTYLGIGLGLLKAFAIFKSPHTMAIIGAWLVILMGVINIKDYFWYGKWFTLSIPKFGKETYKKWMHKATIPATVVMGILVGLCTFPCSGGPYVAILGLISAKTTFFKGFLFLLLYNLMFVLPLVITLLFVSNKRVVGQMLRWETKEKGHIKLIMGLLMIALGVIILIWFV